MSNQIDISKQVFGAKSSAPASKADRPKAQLWINLGYSVEVEDTEGNKDIRFINLPMGLPLDTMEEVATNSSNQTFAAMQVAKNDLLKQLVAAGADLKPGEERIVKLEVQLRRVNDAGSNAALADPNVNPFLRKQTF